MIRTQNKGRLWLTYLLLTLACASWGGVFIMVRNLNVIRAQFGITPWELMWLRFVPAALLFLPVLWVQRREAVQLVRERWWPLFWVGVLTTSVYNWFLITGEEKVPATIASLVIGLGPSVTFILSLIFLKERATWRKLVGIILSVTGLAYISLRSGGSDGKPLGPLPFVLTMMAPISWSLSTIVGKRVLKHYNPLTLTAASVVVGGLSVFPVIFLYGNHMRAVMGDVPPSFWWQVAYLVLLPTVFSYVVWYRGLDHLGATEVSVFTFLVPLFGTTLSSIEEGFPSMAVILGGAAILGGVIVTNLPGRQQR